MDKIKEMGLTLEESEKISVPGIKELPLTLECKVLYKQEQDRNAIPADIVEDCYPADVDSAFPVSYTHLDVYKRQLLLFPSVYLQILLLSLL